MREVSGIEVLINNAGANLGGSFVDQKPDQIELLISLNVTAVARLASAIAARLAKAGTGAIVTSARWWVSHRR